MVQSTPSYGFLQFQRLFKSIWVLGSHPQLSKKRRGYTEFVDALERAEEECRQCGIAAAMAAGTTLGQSALQAGGSGIGSGIWRCFTARWDWNWISMDFKVISMDSNVISMRLNMRFSFGDWNTSLIIIVLTHPICDVSLVETQVCIFCSWEINDHLPNLPFRLHIEQFHHSCGNPWACIELRNILEWISRLQ